MDPNIKKYLASFELGEIQNFKNMAVYPLLTPLNDSPEYMTLKEALEKNSLKVTEVSQSGSVPELKVTNNADIAVLFLDGEELAGAKQNRVLNTTILVKEKSETIIPVSCTEQGRWSYVSDKFQDSGTVITPKLRIVKAQTVASSLRSTGEYRSDQGTVWDTIHHMSAEADVHSQTGAMKDVFEAKKKDIDAYLEAFQCMPKQKGMFVFLSGDVVGFDFISRDSAFGQLHPKLVKSYAMEAILQKGENPPVPDAAKVKAFLEEIDSCSEKKYESIGKGWDCRFEGKLVVGSALIYEEKVIHMAFFRVTESEKAGAMADTRRRKGFRL